MPQVTTDGSDVYYEVAGAGAPLVLLHGGGGNHAAWWQQVPHFAGRYQVITPDLPGFGLSTVKSGNYDTATHVTAVAAVLDDLGLDRAFLVSQSLGGYSGLKYAVDHPDRIAGLIMASTLGPFGDEISALNAAGRAQVQHLRPADFLLTREFVAKEPAKVHLFYQVGSFNETGPGRPKRLSNSLQGAVPIAAIRAAIAAGLHLTVLEGGADVIANKASHDRLRELIPEATVRYVEGAPHSDYWENPERFNEVVDEILATHYPSN
jgi:pimeloyl-ACP methyl ester carboxylesterase